MWLACFRFLLQAALSPDAPHSSARTMRPCQRNPRWSSPCLLARATLVSPWDSPPPCASYLRPPPPPPDTSWQWTCCVFSCLWWPPCIAPSTFSVHAECLVCWSCLAWLADMRRCLSPPPLLVVAVGFGPCVTTLNACVKNSTVSSLDCFLTWFLRCVECCLGSCGDPHLFGVCILVGVCAAELTLHPPLHHVAVVQRCLQLPWRL